MLKNIFTWANLRNAVTLISIVGAVLGVICFIIYVETNRQIGQLYKDEVIREIKNQVFAFQHLIR